MESLSNSDHHSDCSEDIDLDLMSQADIKLIYILKKNYYKTIMEILKLCLSHDKYLNQLGHIAKLPQA